MQLQTNMRLAATTAVVGVSAVRPREEREPRPIEGNGKGLALRTRTQSEQAAILHFGTPPVEASQAREDERLPGELSSAPGGEEDLSHEELQSVQQLRQRDREVRSHEQTHRSIGGQYAGSIHLDLEVGPDGRRYAVAGSTPIDISPVQGDPVATLRKMEVVQRAASAPASPSGADRQVAAEAAHQAQQARAEMAAERYGRARQLARGGAEDEEPGLSQASPRPAPGKDLAPGSLLAIRG